MKRKSTIRTILLVILLIFVLIQFIPVNRDVPEYDATQDFIAMTNPPESIKQDLKIACYDCHSFNTRYPWYSYVAPVSFWLQDHIKDGREELNFSEWGTYTAKKQNHKMEEGAEMVSEGHMPLNSYLWIHTDARLSQPQRDDMAGWFNGLRGVMGGDDEGQDEREEHED